MSLSGPEPISEKKIKNKEKFSKLIIVLEGNSAWEEQL